MNPVPSKLLLRVGFTAFPMIYLLLIWNTVWRNTVPPWEVRGDERQQLRLFYPGRADAALASNDAFVYSAFTLPARIVSGYYIIFFLFVSLKIFNRHTQQRNIALSRGCPSVKRWLYAHCLESPLATLRHHVPIPLPGLSILTVQAPLRYEALMVLFLVSCNVIPLCFFYRVLPADQNVFWSDSHSRRDQILRYLSDRAATLAMGQLPLVILLSGKNSPIAWMCGMEMNQLMTFHRWIARMVWLQMNIHGFGYVVVAFLKSHLARNFRKAYWNWGIVAFAMMWGLTVLSIREIRRKHYEVFVFLHIALCFAAMVGLYLHIHLLYHHKLDIFERAVLASVAFWAFDRVTRLCNRLYLSIRPAAEQRYLEATVSFLTSEIVRLRILIPASRLVLATHLPSETGPTILPRITAGQSIGLTIPSIQWVGDHPFTVMATGLTDAEGQIGYLDLAIKANRGLTKKLGERLRIRTDMPSIPAEVSDTDECSVIIEGPYGRTQEEVHTFDNVLLFAGGVGITFVLPHLVRIGLHSQSTNCKLVWMVRDLDCFSIIQEQLVFVTQQLQARQAVPLQELPFVPLVIEIHITQHERPSPTGCSTNRSIEEQHPLTRISADLFGAEADEDEREQKVISRAEVWNAPCIASGLAPWFDITIREGRASKIVDQHFPVSELSAEQSLSIVSCGPAALCDEVRLQAKLAIAQGSWKSLEYIEECFSW